jgi:hypothetical protein
MVPARKTADFEQAVQEIETETVQKATTVEAFRPTTLECAASGAIMICKNASNTKISVTLVSTQNLQLRACDRESCDRCRAVSPPRFCFPQPMP